MINNEGDLILPGEFRATPNCTYSSQKLRVATLIKLKATYEPQANTREQIHTGSLKTCKKPSDEIKVVDIKVNKEEYRG